MSNKQKQIKEPIESVKRVLENHYVKGMNKTDSYLQEHPNVSREVASVQGHVTLRNPNNREWLVEEMNKDDIPGKSKTALSRMLSATKRDQWDYNAQGRGITLASNIYGWDAPKVSQHSSISIALESKDRPQLQARLQEIMSEVDHKPSV